MRLRKLAAAAVLGLVVFASAAAAERASLQLDEIRKEQALIRAGIDQRTGSYKDLSAANRDQLLAEQHRLLGLIEGRRTAEELTEIQARQVNESVENIRGLLAQSDDDRLVCERRARLGSNRKERVCRTVAQIRADHEAARNNMDGRGVCEDCKSN